MQAPKRKKLAKRKLHQLRKSGYSPEEVGLLAEKFHLLAHKDSRTAKEANKVFARASAKAFVKQIRKECHRDIYSLARYVLDDDCYASI